MKAADLDGASAKLLRIVETSDDPDVRRRAALQLRRVARAMQVVGDAAQDLAARIVALRDRARSFQWPAPVLEWAEEQHDPEMQRRIYRAAREGAYADVDRRLRLAQDALSDGDVASARAEYQRAQARWTAFERQVAEARQRAHDGSRNVLTRWADAVDEAQRDAGNILPDFHETDMKLGLLVLAGVAAFILLGR